MWKSKLFLMSASISVMLLLVFFARHVMPSQQSLAAAIASLTGTQNATSSPQNNTGTTTPTLITALQRLQDQNQLLTNEITDLRTKEETAHLKNIFTRTLKRGNFGNDVKALQTLLSDISSTTATSTTGFYGSVTEREVKNFQMQTGIKGTGVFDPQTRDMLVASIQNQAFTDTVSADGMPIDFSSIPDPQQNIQELQDQISQLSSKLSDTQATIAALQDHVTNLESELSNVQASISAQPSSPSPVTPTAQPLAISSIQVGNLTKTSATITWTTNNPSTSEVDYSQNASMPVNQTLIAKNSTAVTSHSTVLSSLNSGTTYYYHIISKDGSNTIVNSSNLTFTTSH